MRKLWGKTIFFTGTFALVVAGARSRVDPATVLAAIEGDVVRCDGPGVVYLPRNRVLVLDGVTYRFPRAYAKGRFPGRVELRDPFSGEAFLIRAGQGQHQLRYSLDDTANPDFKLRIMDCSVDRAESELASR